MHSLKMLSEIINWWSLGGIKYFPCYKIVFDRGWGGEGRGAPALSDLIFQPYLLSVKLVTDALLQQELKKVLGRGCDVLLSAISRQLLCRHCCAWTNKIQLYWPSYGLLITLQWGLCKAWSANARSGSRHVTGGHGSGTGAAGEGCPPFTGGRGAGLSRAAAPCRGTKRCWEVGFVTFPSSHRAALLWHSPTRAVTGHGASTKPHPVWSQPQPGLCHTARLGPGYQSLGQFLPLSPGLVRDSLTHTQP